MHAATTTALQQKMLSSSLVCRRFAPAPAYWHTWTRDRKKATASAQIGDMLDTVVTWGAVGASIAATSYALFYDWSQGPQQQQEQQHHADMFGPADNFTWGVMGFVSCIPFFNYLAFVQGGLSSSSARLYYWAAALYAVPWLAHGLELDGFTISMLLLGAAHIQVLRVGATEPAFQARLQQQLKPLAVVKTLSYAAGAAATAALGTSTSRMDKGTRAGSSRAHRELDSGSSRAVRDVLQEDDPSQLDEVLRQREELEDFDKRLQQLSRETSD